ncbi:MAG: hypothetical protein K5769_08720 [Pseudobutyrivibrio sp.]|nr:hypothetical protein [Pseudobutyrivibrio sp.]
MFAVYNGTRYRLVKDGKAWELVSKKPESISDGFIKDGGVFYKSVNDLSELEEVFDISIFVEYETHLPNVPSIWELEFSKEFFTDNSVKLVFGMGLLPGWNVEDKNVSSRYVNVSEISRAWIETKSKTNDIEKREEIEPRMLYEKYNEIVSM